MTHAIGRGWKRDALVALCVCAFIGALFADGGLDLAAARFFYRADGTDPWPLGGLMPWSLLYRMAPWITASLVLGGLAALAVGYWRRHGALRRQATFVLLALVIGPGLLINGVFKDHWERPRPRDVVQFGGAAHYAPAPLRGEGGKSFPCGHCSVGFLYGVGWWLWSATRPLLAAASLGTGLAMGIALGIGRMAAGGHFLSDIVWSALIPLFLAHLLYHYVLRIPSANGELAVAGPASVRSALWRLTPLGAALGAAGVLAALFVTAHGMPIAADIPLARFAEPPRVFELAAPTANVSIVVRDEGEPNISIAGELHGFGLPTSRLSASESFERVPAPKLRYAIEQSGWFTDLDAAVSVHLPRGSFERIVVRLGRGNVTVRDETQAHVLRTGALELDVRTDAGQVRVQ